MTGCSGGSVEDQNLSKSAGRKGCAHEVSRGQQRIEPGSLHAVFCLGLNILSVAEFKFWIDFIGREKLKTV